MSKKKLSNSSTRWMQEHFDDEYVKKAQKLGVRSRAFFKIEEINNKDKLIKKGSVMRFVKKNKDWLATQLPDVESALISMDPNTGAIVALVGGFSFKKNKFNHVTQAHRQPGSIFKPFIISSALEKGITPSTLPLASASVSKIFL